MQVVVLVRRGVQLPNLARFDGREQNLRQLQLRLKVGVIKFFFPEELFQYVEIVTGVEIQKPQRPDELDRPVAHAAVQIDEIAIVIVEHLEPVRHGLAQQHRARPAERLNIPLVIQRKQRIQNREDGRLVAHPRHGCLDGITS